MVQAAVQGDPFCEWKYDVCLFLIWLVFCFGLCLRNTRSGTGEAVGKEEVIGTVSLP